MPKLTIDGIEIEVPQGTSVLQACEQLGIEVPRFCYHERLSVPANCRMCLVEMEKSPKPVASCAMPASDGMVIKTNTPLVHKARHGVMEFLLMNHPLDCPICDQGGECDLQDQAIGYGYDRGRFNETKRAVSEKELGPIVSTAMTRCIHCTRCIRFSEEVAGISTLGAFGRSDHMEIGTFIEAAVNSELSGNLVDVCPVGALTAKPYAFVARPWELRKTESIDVMDAVGSNIRIDSRGNEVLRILPRLNESINEEWLADKGRHSVDGLRARRLDRAYVRVEGRLRPTSLSAALQLAGTAVRNAGSQLGALIGPLESVETLTALRDLLDQANSTWVDCRFDGIGITCSTRQDYLFNTGIAGIERADAICLIGSNLRWEAPLIASRVRKRWLAGGVSLFGIGVEHSQTFALQSGADDLAAFADYGAGQVLAEAFSSSVRPAILLGEIALSHQRGETVIAQARALLDTVQKSEDGWNGWNIVTSAASRIAALDLNLLREGGVSEILAAAHSGEVKTLLLIGADDIGEITASHLQGCTTIYIGSHGDVGAQLADIVLPACTYTEAYGTYINLEGRRQLARKAVNPPGEAIESWRILQEILRTSGYRSKCTTWQDLSQMFDQSKSWTRHGFISGGKPFVALDDYYLTNPIARASATMQACSASFVSKNEDNILPLETKRTGTDE